MRAAADAAPQSPSLFDMLAHTTEDAKIRGGDLELPAKIGIFALKQSKNKEARYEYDNSS